MSPFLSFMWYGVRGGGVGVAAGRWGPGGRDGAPFVSSAVLAVGLQGPKEEGAVQGLCPVGSAQVASVVCCRVTPGQKAEVTRLVKATGRTTLSIGDGGVCAGRGRGGGREIAVRHPQPAAD